MARTIYKNISGIHTDFTLITKGSGVPGSVNKVLITNHDNSDSNTIQLHLYDGSTTYVIAETVIPPRVTLVLDDNLAFDSSIYNLRIATSSTAETTIIIK